MHTTCYALCCYTHANFLLYLRRPRSTEKQGSFMNILIRAELISFAFFRDGLEIDN